MMLIAEALVLVFALAVAVVRGLPGRAASPLRALAVIYTDFFRGTPVILVAFVIGFGLPGLNIPWLSDASLFAYGVAALVLVYTAYVTEVYRAGIESVHPSQRRRRARSASRYARRCATSCCRRRCGASSRRC